MTGVAQSIFMDNRTREGQSRVLWQLVNERGLWTGVVNTQDAKGNNGSFDGKKVGG